MAGIQGAKFLCRIAMFDSLSRQLLCNLFVQNFFCAQGNDDFGSASEESFDLVPHVTWGNFCGDGYQAVMQERHGVLTLHGRFYNGFNCHAGRIVGFTLLASSRHYQLWRFAQPICGVWRHLLVLPR